VPVNFVPSYTLGQDSGLTTDEISGRLEIYVNDQEPHVRQRFTLLHEFKHALDFEHADLFYARLGSGDPERHERQVEAIANEFAANVLMPTVLVKRAWFRTQNLSVLGLIGEPKPVPRMYFRSAGRVPELDVAELAAFVA
jgi:Zn-dependent peptidase ImmA (M78 family)